MYRQRNPLTLYEVFGAGIWTVLITTTADILKGTAYIAPMLLLLIGGALVFLILFPMVLFRPLLPLR